MADSGRSPIGGTFEEINEAVVKPVTDEVGKALETGLQSITGSANPQNTQTSKPQQTPSDAGKSAQVDQTKLIEARRKIKWWQDLEEAQRRVREEKNQKQAQVAQTDQQQKQVKQFEVTEKQNKDVALQQAKTKTEIRGGVGG